MDSGRREAESAGNDIASRQQSNTESVGRPLTRVPDDRVGARILDSCENMAYLRDRGGCARKGQPPYMLRGLSQLGVATCVRVFCLPSAITPSCPVYDSR
jgi:hypothetical protein